MKPTNLYSTMRDAQIALAGKIQSENKGRRWRIDQTENGWFTVIQDRAERVQISFAGTCVEITAMPSQGKMLVYRCSHWEHVSEMCRTGLLRRSVADPFCNNHVDVYLP